MKQFAAFVLFFFLLFRPAQRRGPRWLPAAHFSLVVTGVCNIDAHQNFANMRQRNENR